MENATMAVASFEMQVKANVGVVRFRRGKVHSPFDKLVDGLWTIFDKDLDRILFAEACTGFAGVFLVQFEGILRVSDGTNAALGVIG
jgi:hypothetical protein